MGNVVYAGSQWGMLVVLAKLVSPQGVGQFALALAVTAPVFMLTNLQLRAIQASDVTGKYLLGDYLGLRLLLTALALPTILAIVFVAGYSRETAMVVLAVGVAKAVESWSDIFYGSLQQRERMDRSAISMLIKGPLSLAAMGLSVYLTRSVFWGAVGLTGSWAAVLVGYDVRVVGAMQRSPHRSLEKLTRPRWEFGTLARLVRLAWPLGLVTFLISLNANIPRYFVEHYLGERELGIFAGMAYLLVAGGMVVNALGQAATARLARHYTEGDVTAFGALIFKLLGVGVVLGLLGIIVALLAGRQVLTLLYRPEYAEHLDVLLALMVAAGLSHVTSFLGYGMTAAGYYRVQAPLFGAVAGATVLASALLVPPQGILGAALAVILTSALGLVGSLLVNLHALRRLSTQAPPGQPG